ncbi:MAG: VOC family protein [Alcaligenaceae bacterium]|nr:MAG: VOC family protein [Alcaligenaceae bacterium]
MIDHLDHLVLTSCDPDATIAFYTGVLGMKLESFGQGRRAFLFGNQKINLHVRGREFEPKAHLPVPGALDLCFIADRPLDPGPIRSVYLRDPDFNLIEISEYVAS